MRVLLIDDHPLILSALQTVQALLQHRAVDTIAARRRIAGAIIEANRYPL